MHSTAKAVLIENSIFQKLWWLNIKLYIKVQIISTDIYMLYLLNHLLKGMLHMRAASCKMKGLVVFNVQWELNLSFTNTFNGVEFNIIGNALSPVILQA